MFHGGDRVLGPPRVCRFIYAVALSRSRAVCAVPLPWLCVCGFCLRYGGEALELDTLAFLYVGFKKRFRYWESVNMARKLVLVAVMTFVQRTPLRVYVSMWSLSFFLLLQVCRGAFAPSPHAPRGGCRPVFGGHVKQGPVSANNARAGGEGVALCRAMLQRFISESCRAPHGPPVQPTVLLPLGGGVRPNADSYCSTAVPHCPQKSGKGSSKGTNGSWFVLTFF